MIGALTWLLGSKTGRYFAIALLAVVGAGIAIRFVYARGARAEQAKQALSVLQNVLEKVRSDEDIRSLAPAERRERLYEWSRG